MSTLFKGLAENYRARTTPNNNFAGEGEVFIAQVLDVVKDGRTFDGNTLADAPTAVGAIRFNKAGVKKKPEKDVTDVALPLDRSNYRLPVIGEQVLVVHKNGIYHYFAVLTSITSMAINIDPNLLEDAYESSGPPLISVDPKAEAARFISRNDYNQSTILTTSSLFTRVREGETILEGRMGGVIKLTHTITKDGVWDKEKQIANIGQSTDGDPMLIMKSNVRRKLVTDVGFVLNNLEDDDINTDASSFYLTTTQNIPLQIAASVSMSTWSVELNKLDTQASQDESLALGKFFPDSYDPNDVVGINVNGLTTTGTPFLVNQLTPTATGSVAQ